MLTQKQREMLAEIRQKQPVSAFRLNMRGHRRRTFKALVTKDLLETHSTGLFGHNWNIKEED